MFAAITYVIHHMPGAEKLGMLVALRVRDRQRQPVPSATRVAPGYWF